MLTRSGTPARGSTSSLAFILFSCVVDEPCVKAPAMHRWFAVFRAIGLAPPVSWAAMSDDPRPPASTLKGRLADVFVPALVSGNVESLSRRLGNRATIDDPLSGRASTLAS